jgi:hypothetical protein
MGLSMQTLPTKLRLSYNNPIHEALKSDTTAPGNKYHLEK